MLQGTVEGVELKQRKTKKKTGERRKEQTLIVGRLSSKLDDF